MTIIRKLSQDDYQDWLKLYQIYADHYKVKLFDKGIKTTWGWLIDISHPLICFIAEDQNQIVGLVHCRSMPSPLRGQNIGFLDDIVIHPERRGIGIAEMLIEKVKAHGQKEGWKVTRWITRDDNYRARKVYDRLSVKTDWNVYEMNCE